MEIELLERVNSVSNKMQSILEESRYLRTIIEERIARMETYEESEYSEESLESEEDTEVSSVLDIWRWFCSRRR
jgi:predicted DNA-binding protein